MSATLSRTPLYDWHLGRGARIVDFGGWAMPVVYSSIVAEHQATRGAVGLFDISHMGRLRFDGAAAGTFLDSQLTRRVADTQPGQVRYSLITNESGGILDDVLVYQLRDLQGALYHLMVVNASNREKILSWLRPRLPAYVRCTDVTTKLGMVAVQGPRSLDLLGPQVENSLAEMSYYTAVETRFHGHPCVISRTGYTGEDGLELIAPAEALPAVWQRLLDDGAPLGAQPAGLGARDTLRLEAGMPLYGHELTEEIDPISAGLKFAVNIEGRTFPGCEALREIAERGPARRRVGLTLEGKRVPREHYLIQREGQTIGHVTSGTFSPTFERPIAMGYVETAHSQVGNQVAIDLRGRLEPAEVVRLPFYRRPAHKKS